MDKITLKGMRIYGFHGVYPFEKEKGQYYEVDAELFLSLDEAAEWDNFNKSVDYAQVFKFIHSKFTGESVDLIETIAVKLANAVLSEFPVDKVICRVRKPNPPVKGHIDYTEVEVKRGRQ